MYFVKEVIMIMHIHSFLKIIQFITTIRQWEQKDPMCTN